MKVKILILVFLITVIPTLVQAKGDKHDNIVKKLWSKPLAIDIILTCNKYAKNPADCKQKVTMIGGTESNFCKNSYRNNCFGINNGKYPKSQKDSIHDFIKRYNKYWYKNLTPNSFYSNNPKIIPKANYCRSEYQPNGKLLNYCPQGFRNSSHYFNLFI